MVSKKKPAKAAAKSSAKASKSSTKKSPSAKKQPVKKPAAKSGGSKKKTSVKKTGSSKKSSSVTTKTKSQKSSTLKVAAKKVAASKVATKTISAKKGSPKKSSPKKGSPKKSSPKKSSPKKSTAKKGSAKKAPAKKGSKPSSESVKSVAAKIVAKQAANKQAAKTSKPKKSGKKKSVKVQVSSVPSPSKTAGKKTKKVGVAVPAASESAKAPLKPARLRSQPVEVQEIDQRVDRMRHGRLRDYTPRSYGSSPKKPKPKDIIDLLSKNMGKAPTLPAKQMPATVVELGIFCIFAIGGNSAKVSLEATNRLTKRFPVWNEFRVSEAYEFLETLEGIELVEAYDHCEQVLEFVNEIYKDQNEVDLEFLKDMDAEDRLVALNRYRSLGPALSQYMALALQGFEGILFNYSWARAIQRVGIVERTGSPKKLCASVEKTFQGLDTVTLLVDLIDLGEEICLPKNPHCAHCYLVLYCKSRKV